MSGSWARWNLSSGGCGNDVNSGNRLRSVAAERNRARGRPSQMGAIGWEPEKLKQAKRKKPNRPTGSLVGAAPSKHQMKGWRCCAEAWPNRTLFRRFLHAPEQATRKDCPLSRAGKVGGDFCQGLNDMSHLHGYNIKYSIRVQECQKSGIFSMVMEFAIRSSGRP